MKFCFEFLKFIEGDEFSIFNYSVTRSSNFDSAGERAKKLKSIRERFLPIYKTEIIDEFKRLI